MKKSDVVDILLVAADFALLTINSDGIILSSSPGIRGIFNRQEGEVEGLSLCELIPELKQYSSAEFDPIQPRGGMSLMDDEDAEVGACRYLEFLAANEEVTGEFELRVDFEGNQKWISISTYKLLHQGDIVFAVILDDVTRRKNAEEEIRELNENLELRVDERTAQIKNMVNSCGSELGKINSTYQDMKERHMSLMEGIEARVIDRVAGLSEIQQNKVREALQSELIQCMNLYSEDQITDQKFMLTIMSLNEIFGGAQESNANLKPGQLSGTDQDEVDDLLASLGI